MATNVNGVQFSEAEIEAMKNGGGVAAKSLKQTPKGDIEARALSVVNANQSSNTSIWGTAPKINEVQKVTQPTLNNEDGSPNPQEKVTRPNISRYNAQHSAAQLALIEAQEAEEKRKTELADVIDPEKLQVQLRAMSRKIAKLEKQLKAQEAD